MKRILKILQVVFGSIAIILVLLFLFVLYKANTAWKGHITKSELKRITSHINNSPELPKQFYFVHDSIHRKFRQRNAIYGAINKLREQMKEYPLEENPFKISIYGIESPVNVVSHPLTQNHIIKDTARGYWFISGIQKYTTSQKCFDYYLNNAHINVSVNDTTEQEVIGINNLSKFLFNKELEQLEKKEIIKLIRVLEYQNEFMMLTHPHIYLKKKPVPNRVDRR